MPEKSIPFEPHFGAFVLETLTVGMYGESRNALREYVQNSFDAIRHAEKTKILKVGRGRIDITLSADRNQLTIRDNGAGLNADIAANTLAAIGSSSKDFRHDAGFRGIGRLSGIVFSDRLVFTTKAKGESRQTTVVFDAKSLRDMMSPMRGSEEDAADVLKKCVTATVSDDHDPNAHFFEVQLIKFTNPPRECTDVAALKSFLGQVAPLPYRADFPFSDRIKKSASDAGVPIDEVMLTVKDGSKPQEPLFKPYGKDYGVQQRRVALQKCNMITSSTNRWWGWIGVKKTSGSYKEDEVRGLRVRLRNIQVDGIQLMQTLFASSEERRSYLRFSDWYVGEIFIKPESVVPNARRDGFEEDREWITIKDELRADICLEYGRLAYKVSKADQYSIENIEKKMKTLETGLAALKRSRTQAAITKFGIKIMETEEKISEAVDGADLGTSSRFRVLEDKLAALRASYYKQFTPPQTRVTIDLDALQEQARDDLLKELIDAFRKQLEPTLFSKVRNITRTISGKPEL